MPASVPGKASISSEIAPRGNRSDGAGPCHARSLLNTVKVDWGARQVASELCCHIFLSGDGRLAPDMRISYMLIRLASMVVTLAMCLVASASIRRNLRSRFDTIVWYAIQA